MRTLIFFLSLLLSILELVGLLIDFKDDTLISSLPITLNWTITIVILWSIYHYLSTKNKSQ